MQGSGLSVGSGPRLQLMVGTAANRNRWLSKADTGALLQHSTSQEEENQEEGEEWEPPGKDD